VWSPHPTSASDTLNTAVSQYRGVHVSAPPGWDKFTHSLGQVVGPKTVRQVISSSFSQTAANASAAFLLLYCRVLPKDFKPLLLPPSTILLKASCCLVLVPVLSSLSAWRKRNGKQRRTPCRQTPYSICHKLEKEQLPQNLCIICVAHVALLWPSSLT
jgi:hypothetical protein